MSDGYFLSVYGSKEVVCKELKCCKKKKESKLAKFNLYFLAVIVVLATFAV